MPSNLIVSRLTFEYTGVRQWTAINPITGDLYDVKFVGGHGWYVNENGLPTAHDPFKHKIAAMQYAATLLPRHLPIWTNPQPHRYIGRTIFEDEHHSTPVWELNRYRPNPNPQCSPLLAGYTLRMSNIRVFGFLDLHEGMHVAELLTAAKLNMIDLPDYFFQFPYASQDLPSRLLRMPHPYRKSPPRLQTPLPTPTEDFAA